MSKFNAGDKVRRISGAWGNSRTGSEHVVRAAHSDGLKFEGDTVYTYSAEEYTLVQADPTESAYLTPQQTLENLLHDVPTQAMHCGEWLDINELDNVSVNFLRSMKCRTKPETVRVGEYEVVKPQQRINIADTRTRYVIKQGLANVEEVQPDFLLDSRLFWETREDAYAALQVIKKTLLGETK